MVREKSKPSNGGKNTWESFFPEKQDTEAHRIRFLARMGYISIAHYFLYRRIVPSGVFKRRRLDDNTVFYCFDHEKRWGKKLSGMMKGMKEAIEKKYLESAFIMINENPEKQDSVTEVFTIRFAYSKEMEFTIVNDKGNPIVSMHYAGEESFRNQVKHLIKKINAVTKVLKPLNPKVVPYFKLAYHSGTPEGYEPANFHHCEEAYTFGAAKPIYYDYGQVTTDSTAIAINLKSVYIKNKKDVARLEDALTDEAGHENGQYFENIEAALDISRFEDDDPRRSLSPEHATPQLEMVVEVPRHNSNEHSGGENENPLDNIDSMESKIQQDETIDKETPQSDSSIEKQQQMIKTPPKRRGPKRMLTPRLRPSAPLKRKLSISDSEVMKSPQDSEDYDGNNSP